MGRILRIFLALIFLVFSLTATLVAGGNHGVEKACRSYIQSTLGWNPADLEIEFRRYIEPAIDWKNVSLQVSHSPNADLCGVLTLRVAAVRNGKTLRSFPVPVQITLYDSVLVTARRLKRHTIISQSDLTLERCKIDLGRITPFTDLGDVVGKRTSRALIAGKVVESSMVEENPLVKRGDRVTVRFLTGSLLLTTIGEALEDGWKGRPVRIKNLSSKKQITGVVAGVGLVDLMTTVAGL